MLVTSEMMLNGTGRRIFCATIAGAISLLLINVSHAYAQSVCGLTNTSPCIVPNGTTILRVETTGNGSSVQNLGVVDEDIDTLDDLSGVDNVGSVGGNIRTSGDGSNISNAGTVTGFIETRGENSAITNSGSADAVFARAVNSSVINSGTTNQDVTLGALNSTFENSGTVNGNIFSFGSGVRVINTDSIGGFIQTTGDNSTVENTGTVGASNTGAFDDAVAIGGLNTRFNNSGDVLGQILTVGVETAIINTGMAGSILVADSAVGANVTNSGIVASDINVQAADVSVENSGTVQGAILALRENAAITNSGGVAGRVETSGAVSRVTNSGAIGSFSGAGDNTRLINSGLIGRSGADSITFLGSGASLAVLPGSIIKGNISFLGGGTQTLEIGNGLSIDYTFSATPNRIMTNGAPFILSGNRLATLDSTIFSTQDEQLADLTSGISSVLDRRLYGLRLQRQETATRSRSSAAGASPAAAQAVWIDTFGSYRNQDSDGAVTSNTQWVGGLMFGTDPVDIGGVQTGFFVGGSKGRVKTDTDSQSVDSQSFFVGTYATTQGAGLTFDLALTAGYSSFDQERQVLNNLVAGGVETATADFDGWFVSPALTVTKPVEIAGHRLEGSLALRYAGLFLDGYTESGATANQTVDSRNVHIGVMRLQIAAPFESVSADGSFLSYRLRAGFEARTNFGGDTIEGALLGQDISFNPGGDDSVLGGYLSLSGEYLMTNGMNIEAGAEGIIESTGSYQVSAYAGLEIRF